MKRLKPSIENNNIMTECFSSFRRTQRTVVSLPWQKWNAIVLSLLSKLLLLLVIFLDLTSTLGSCKSCHLKCRWDHRLKDRGERNKGTETCGFSEILPPSASRAINCLSKSQQAPPVICFLGNGTHSITHNFLNKQKCPVLVSYRCVATS